MESDKIRKECELSLGLVLKEIILRELTDELMKGNNETIINEQKSHPRTLSYIQDALEIYEESEEYETCVFLKNLQTEILKKAA